MLLQEISRNYIHIQHQALNFLWFKKKWVVDVVAPTIFSYTLSVSVSAILFLTYKIRADVLSSALIPLIR